MPYYALSEGLRYQYGFIEDPGKLIPVAKLIAHDKQLLKAKQARLFDDYTWLLSNKHGPVLRIRNKQMVELTDSAGSLLYTYPVFTPCI